MIDITTIWQSFQIGRVVGDWVSKSFNIRHLDEMIKGFEYLKNAKDLEDIIIAYSYFKKASPVDKKIVHACSLYGKAVCLPFMRQYDNAVWCVEELRKIQCIRRPGYLGGTWFYKRITDFQSECDNLLVQIEEVRKVLEPIPEQEFKPISSKKRGWLKILIGVFVVLLIGVFIYLFFEL